MIVHYHPCVTKRPHIILILEYACLFVTKRPHIIKNMVVDMEVNKVANEVADMEMDMVADIEVDKVLGTTKSFS